MKLQTATIDLTRPEITQILAAGESFKIKNIGVGFCPIVLTVTPADGAPANSVVEVSGSGFITLNHTAGYRFITEAVSADGVVKTTANCFGDDVVITNTLPVSVTVVVASPLGKIKTAWVGAVNLDTNVINCNATISLLVDTGVFAVGTVNNLWGTLNFFGKPLAQNTSIQQPLFAFKVVDSATGAPYEFDLRVPYTTTYPVASVAVMVTNLTTLANKTFTLAVLQQGSGY